MRFSFLGRLAAVAAVILPFAIAAPTPNVEARDTKPNGYIIVFHQNVTAPTMKAHHDSLAPILSNRVPDLKVVGHQYALDLFKGYAIEADAATLAAIAAMPEVAYVAQDAVMQASVLTTQSSSTWGLARVSHRNTGFSSYVYDTSGGSTATAYVVDTGIYIGHSVCHCVAFLFRFLVD
jgi:hypothetical protein